jgi:chemotaxis protein MotA
MFSIVGGHIFEGGHVSDIVQPTAFLIVVGGTLASGLMQYTPREFINGLKSAKSVFFYTPPPLQSIIDKIVSLSTKARREGMLALERELATVDDDFMKRALEMAADGIPVDQVRHTLELEIGVVEHDGNINGKMWEAMGGYAPTIGIIGAVLGLIHVMQNLSDPTKLGAGIAVAFVATVYGVGFANLFFMPMGMKLKDRTHARVQVMELVCEGVCSIAAGENPLLTERKLKCYLHDGHGGGGGAANEAVRDLAANG